MRKLPEIEVRRANLDDYAEVMECADRFFAYGGTDASEYDRAIFGSSAMECLSFDTPESLVFVATHNDKVVGYYALHYGRVYSRRPMLYEYHFCVNPDYVRSHAGRKLTKRAIDYGREINAICFYAGATSGIKQFDNSLINMYSKLGFQHSGIMMRFDYGKI